MNTAQERTAIERLKAFEPADGYYLAYSGGKDSEVILALADMAGVKFHAVHNLTTADAPETIYHVRSKPQVEISRPERSMWQLIPDKLIPPTRVVRYCCSELKERNGTGEIVVTGVRWAESTKRANNSGLVQINGKPKATETLAQQMGVDYQISRAGSVVLNNDNEASRRMMEHCYQQQKTVLNPIIDWNDADVWDFIRAYGIKYNPLYDEGFSRVGCVGCPMSGNRSYKDFVRWPKYKNLYIAAFGRMVKRRFELGLMEEPTCWHTGEDTFQWWMQEDPNQLTLDLDEHTPPA